MLGKPFFKIIVPGETFSLEVYEDLPGKPTSFSGGMKGCFA
jgi:hypothetical protein